MCVQNAKNTFSSYKNRDFLELILRNFAFGRVFLLKNMESFANFRLILPLSLFDSMALNLDTVKVIYFDIDNTLVDHSHAENKALTLFFEQYSEEFPLATFEKFTSVYRASNLKLWQKLAKKEVTVEEVRARRFLDILQEFSGRDNLTFEDEAHKMGIRYMKIYEKFWELFDGASQAIEKASKIAPLGLLSNGFRKQVLGKIKQFDWENTFHHVVISEDVGVMKPHREIFDHTLTITGYTKPEEMLYIGDHYDTDIIGASEAGWQTVWVNVHNEIKIDSVADDEVSSIGGICRLFDLLKS
ncbi:MAG: HAD family hydrolase [Ignavibacteriae bacterium]|nr:HAD family hydrolase [Ignavibacteriota bacterium]